MSKSVKFEDIKKCLQKIKDWVNKIFETCIKTHSTGEIDFNKDFSPGFFNIPYRSNVQNSPNSILFEYGTAANIVVPKQNGIAQLAFQRNATDTFAARWGSMQEDLYNIASHSWLYFHGSTSPNIPVLKKKTVTGTTSVNGNLILSPLTKANAIVLAVIEVENINNASLVCSAYTGSAGNWLAHVISDGSPFSVFKEQNMTVTVYYLEIPSGYQIPDTTPTSSNEPLDDSELSPQQNLQ